MSNPDNIIRCTGAELAERAGVSRSTVYDWLKKGRLPSGVEHESPEERSFVVNVAALNAWKAARR